MLSRNEKAYKEVAEKKFEIASWTLKESGWADDDSCLDAVIASQLHAFVMGGVFGAQTEDVEVKTIQL
jgi:hypothetical protein